MSPHQMLKAEFVADPVIAKPGRMYPGARALRSTRPSVHSNRRKGGVRRGPRGAATLNETKKDIASLVLLLVRESRATRSCSGFQSSWRPGRKTAYHQHFKR